MAYFYSWHSKDLLCITSMKNRVLNNAHFSCKNWNTYKDISLYTKITTNKKCFKDPLKQWVRGYQIQYIFSKIQQSKCLHQNFFPKKFYILLVPTTFLSPLKFRYLHCFLCLVTSLDLVLQVTYIFSLWSGWSLPSVSTDKGVILDTEPPPLLNTCTTSYYTCFYNSAHSLVIH